MFVHNFNRILKVARLPCNAVAYGSQGLGCCLRPGLTVTALCPGDETQCMANEAPESCANEHVAFS